MMKKQPLVSMITYCYNGERFVSQYFESILKQTWNNLELIFFNNGSTDRTGEIAEEYKKKLEARSIKVNLIHYKDNQCTCMLKQIGFNLMNGDYFFGCDSDDYIDKTYVEEMANYLIKNPDKGIVYCQLRVVEEETGITKSIMKMIPRTTHKEAFLDILNGNNINFTAISYMMNRKIFEEINTSKTIYQSLYGENYQIQIPFLYNDLQGYIEKPLGQYTVRKDSYSGTLNYEKMVKAFKGQEESVVATLNQINADSKYKDIFLKRIRKDRFYASIFNKDKSYVEECYRELKEVNNVGKRELLCYLLHKIGLLNLAIKIRRS